MKGNWPREIPPGVTVQRSVGRCPTPVGGGVLCGHQVVFERVRTALSPLGVVIFMCPKCDFS